MLQWTLALGAVLAFTAIAVAWTLARERRRSRALAEVARKLGFQFQAEGKFLLGEGLERLPLFAVAGLARWASIRNVMRGSVDARPILICDYHYATGAASRRTDYYHSVAAFGLAGAALPDFAVRPVRSPLGRAALASPLARPLTWLLPSGEAMRAAFAAADEQRIDVAAPAAFAAHYAVSGGDPAAVRRLLRQELLEYLASREQPLFVESAGGWLAVFRRRYVAPQAIPEFVAEARAVAGWLLR